MKISNSYRLHFLRLEGERSCNIRNPIVAFESVDHGCFYPRRPEPGETYLYGTCFASEHELNSFLLDRELNYVDHDKLIRDEDLYGINPYFEFVSLAEDSGSCLQPGMPSIGGWQRHRAFHHCVAGYVLDMRSKLMLAAEFLAVCRNPFAVLRAPCPFDTDAHLDEAVARMRHVRKHLWAGKRVKLPPSTPRFYREAQLWQLSRPKEHLRICDAEAEGRCSLEANCRCANVSEYFQQIERKWDEEYRRDDQSIREQLAANGHRNIWDDER